MKIFFGAAIQGASNREERAAVHRLIINALKNCGCEVISEHTTGKDYDSTVGLLEDKLGSLPPRGMERSILIRNKKMKSLILWLRNMMNPETLQSLFRNPQSKIPNYNS